MRWSESEDMLVCLSVCPVCVSVCLSCDRQLKHSENTVIFELADTRTTEQGVLSMFVTHTQTKCSESETTRNVEKHNRKIEQDQKRSQKYKISIVRVNYDLAHETKRHTKTVGNEKHCRNSNPKVY